MSLFITFEGGEGSGKSAQAGALLRKLRRLNIPAVLTHEPGGTPFGEKLAHWLKGADNDISPLVELVLFNACRNHSVTEVIKPGLDNGKVVISDRYADSTIAYQGYGRGLGLEMVRTINSAATQGLEPDLTILLDIPAEDGLARKGNGQDRFEQEELAFHQRVRQGYLRMAADEPKRWLVVDASQSKRKIAGVIWQRVDQLLSNQGG